MNNTIIDPSPISGMPELLPETQIILNDLLDTIRRNYELAGFAPIDTHLMEDYSILDAKRGDNILYAVSKSGRSVETWEKIEQTEESNKRQLWLRFDLTVPATRYAIEHFADITFPFRRYQIQKVYRGERPQDGKFNEFYQADIDIFGNEALPISADVEILTTIDNVLNDLDIGGYTIHLNNKRVWVWLLETLGIMNTEKQNEILSIVDKSPKIWKNETFTELSQLISDKAMIQVMNLTFNTSMNPSDILKDLRDIDNVTLQLWLQELDTVYNQALALWVPKERLVIDPATIRGLNYYTGTIYETFLDGEEWLWSICSWGRYDDLAGLFSKERKLPWVGVSIGVSRLLSRLIKMGKYNLSVKTPSKVLVTRIQKEYEQKYLEILWSLRKAGIPSELYLDDSVKIGKQLGYANKKWIPYAIIAGEDELSKNEVQLKHMYTGDKEQISLSNIVNRIQMLLNKS